MREDITFIYYFTDNFVKVYKTWIAHKLLPDERVREREGRMSLAELLCILLCFYTSPCKDFKSYYLYYLPSKHRGCFAHLSYSRFIQLLPRLLLPLTVLLHCLRGEDSGIYYIDSTKLAVCHAKRTGSNRVFKHLCNIGKSSYGWFMGYKLHVLINNKGHIMAISITRASTVDLSQLTTLTKHITGKLFADKAYISKALWTELMSKGLKLYTALRKGMKQHFISITDKLLLRKRSLIESLFNVLKNRMNLEHTRHRSPTNFLIHILACLSAYALKSVKLSSHIIIP